MEPKAKESFKNFIHEILLKPWRTIVNILLKSLNIFLCKDALNYDKYYFADEKFLIEGGWKKGLNIFFK